MLRRIRYFLKTAESGSFSRAAKEEFVTPQALAKQIALLEEELGGELFYRTPKGVSLTPLGQFAMQKYQFVEQLLEETTQAIREFARNSKELLRVGIFASLPKEEVIFPMVDYFLTSCPEYQFNLEMIELEEGRRKLMDGKLDLLLTNIHEEDDIHDFSAYSFEQHEVKIVVSARHPWSKKKSVTEEDLRGESFIKMQVRGDHYRVPAEESFYHRIPCKKVIEARNFETMMILIQQGSGFAVFPMVFSNMEAAKVKAFAYPGKGLTCYTALLVSNENKEKGLRVLIGRLIQEFDLKPV